MLVVGALWGCTTNDMGKRTVSTQDDLGSKPTKLDKRLNRKEIAPSPWKIIVKSDEYRKWKSDVRRRCNYQCKQCGKDKKASRKVRFDCHHIKPKYLFPNDMFKIDNGVLLCQACHIEAHKAMKLECPEYNSMTKVSTGHLWKLVKQLHFETYNRRRYRRSKTVRNNKRG